MSMLVQSNLESTHMRHAPRNRKATHCCVHVQHTHGAPSDGAVINGRQLGPLVHGRVLFGVSTADVVVSAETNLNKRLPAHNPIVKTQCALNKLEQAIGRHCLHDADCNCCQSQISQTRPSIPWLAALSALVPVT